MKKQILSSIVALAISTALTAQLPVSQTADNKNVVLEEFTGLHCSSCPDGHKIAQEIKTANPDDVVLINIHVGGYATPNAGEPDFRTPFGLPIEGQSDLQGYPAGTINRHLFSGNSQPGGSGTAQSRGTWATTSATVLAESAYANVALESSLNIQTRELTVDVEVYYTANGSATNKLNVALMQSHIEGPQSGASSNPSQVLPNGNYEHNHVLRHLITGQWGDEITTTAQGTLITRQYTFTVPTELNGVPYELGDLSVVAFLAEGNQEIITGAEGPLDFVVPNGSNLVDLASSTNMQLPTTYCDGNINPQITVSNPGNIPVSAYDVSYSLDGATAVSQSLSTTLAVGATNNITFPALTLLPGAHKIKYTVNPTNQTDIELINNNNNSYSADIYVLSATTMGETHTEGFENSSLGDDAPSNAISDNPEGITAFVIHNGIDNSVSQNLGGFGNSNNSYIWDFYTINSGSSKIVFDKLDFSSGTEYNITFTHAYAQYNNENDKLEVLVSTDCGVTWSNEYSKQGTALKTAAAHSDRFYPEVSEWASDYIDLSSYAGQAEVMIAFKGTSAFGNDLYLDDIQIHNPINTSIEEESTRKINAYPNPTNGLLTISLENKSASIATVSIINNLGQVILTNKAESATSTISLDLSSLENGVYFANISVDGKTEIKQITVLK